MNREGKRIEPSPAGLPGCGPQRAAPYPGFDWGGCYGKKGEKKEGLAERVRVKATAEGAAENVGEEAGHNPADNRRQEVRRDRNEERLSQPDAEPSAHQDSLEQNRRDHVAAPESPPEGTE